MQVPDSARWSATATVLAALMHVVFFGVLSAHMADFNVDIARDFGRALDLVEHGELSEVGPVAGGSGFDLGPALYVVLAPMVAVSSDPLILQRFFVGLSGLALLIFGIALRRVVSASTLLLVLVWLVATGLWAAAQWLPWHSSLLPVVIATIVLSLERLAAQSDRRWALVAVFGAALAVQLHATAVTYGLVVVVALITRVRWLGWRWLLASAGFGVLMVMPLLMRVFASTGDGEVPGLSSTASFAEVFMVALSPNWASPGVSGVVRFAAWLLPVGALGAVLTARDESGFGFASLMLLCLGLGLAVAAWAVRFDPALRYFHVVIYPLLICFGIGIRRLVPAVRDSLALALSVAIVLAGLSTIWAAPRCSLGNQRAVAWSAAGLSADQFQTHLHGDVCRAPITGWEYFARVAPRSETTTSHLLVLDEPRASGWVEFADSAVDFDRTAVTLSDGGASIDVELSRQESVHVQFAARRGSVCPLAGATFTPLPVHTIHSGPIDIHRLRLTPVSRTFRLEIGPCEGLSSVEIY